jgi:hypothetical protein
VAIVVVLQQVGARAPATTTTARHAVVVRPSAG